MKDCVALDWNGIYNIGHTKVDSEHQRLFELANKLIENDRNQDEVMKAVKELIKYTKFHFASEEQYMKSINFTHLENHKKLHKNIVSKLNNITKNINTISYQDMAKLLYKFITKNIINHILTEDKRVHHFRRTADELREIFQWKDIYKVGDKQIDDEHKKLFEIALKALEHKKTDSKNYIRNTLCELYDYMKIHFENEEKYMKKIGYKEIEEHKKLHSDIIKQLNHFIEKLPSLTVEQFERRLIEYIDVWLIYHIIVEDNKMIQSQSQANREALTYKIS